MKKSVLFAWMFIFVFTLASAALAQGDNKSVDTSLKVSGRLYMQWYDTVTNRNEEESVNSFELTRAYLIFAKDFDEVWGARVTLDAGNDNGEDTRYQMYVKFAYLQARLAMGPGILTFRAGMIPLAVGDKINALSDYRWIADNYISGSSVVIYNDTAGKGLSLDSTADLGVGMNLALGKIISLDLQATNGDGYKRTQEKASSTVAENADDGKAYMAMLTLRPIDVIYILAYARYQETLDHEYRRDNFKAYAGGSVMYISGPVKVGVNVVAARASQKDVSALPDDDALVRNYLVTDAFVHINLAGITGVPILMAGRYAFGRTDFDEGYAANDGSRAEVTLWAVGLGWRFNEYIRFMAYYEDRNSVSDDIAALDWEEHDRVFYVKNEVRF